MQLAAFGAILFFRIHLLLEQSALLQSMVAFGAFCPALGTVAFGAFCLSSRNSGFWSNLPYFGDSGFWSTYPYFKEQWFLEHPVLTNPPMGPTTDLNGSLMNQ